MIKTFCDMCKEKEIIGGAPVPGAFTFSFIKNRTSVSDIMNIQDKHILLCEECAEKVAQFLIDNGLNEKEIVYR